MNKIKCVIPLPGPEEPAEQQQRRSYIQINQFTPSAETHTRTQQHLHTHAPKNKGSSAGFYNTIGSAKNLPLVQNHFSLYRVLGLSCMELSLEIEDDLHDSLRVLQSRVLVLQGISSGRPGLDYSLDYFHIHWILTWIL